MDTLFKGSDDPVDALFLLDQDWPTDIVNTTSKTPQKTKDENKENEPKATTPKRRGGRKKGQKVNKIKEEPYVKTEVMDSHRTHQVYGLRQRLLFDFFRN